KRRGARDWLETSKFVTFSAASCPPNEKSAAVAAIAANGSRAIEACAIAENFRRGATAFFTAIPWARGHARQHSAGVSPAERISRALKESTLMT
ncbi:MAG TPA: hypothetical protein VJ454_12100, partial [Steroidobacteraceae bacterium]|nr:hypothetical protein [Steroidobacteraceae bacterium]